MYIPFYDRDGNVMLLWTQSTGGLRHGRVRCVLQDPARETAHASPQYRGASPTYARWSSRRSLCEQVFSETTTTTYCLRFIQPAIIESTEMKSTSAEIKACGFITWIRRVFRSYCQSVRSPPGSLCDRYTDTALNSACKSPILPANVRLNKLTAKPRPSMHEA